MLTSINLNSVPFLSSTDATRASMASKQIQQALTSPNTEIPYVIGSDYYHIRDNSSMGINLAKDDGKVIYKNQDLLIVFYKNLNNLEELYIPPVKKTHSNFGTSIRSSLNINDEFKKGDVLSSYDCFLDGIPTYGYNTFTGFFPFFGYNHEDSVIVSESFADKAKVVFIDKVYVPVYEYTLMQPYYKDTNNSYVYFPSIGQKIKDDIICCLAMPKGTENIIGDSSNIKNKIQTTLKTMNLSGLLSLNTNESLKFSIDKIKSKIKNGTISGIKIHRLKPSKLINMIDSQLQNIIEKLHITIYGKYIADIYHSLTNTFDIHYAQQILKNYYICTDKKKRGDIDLRDACYLLEFEITKTDTTHYGDKIANRYANKGVISLILPDDLRPVTQESDKFLDLILSPFGKN